MKTIGVPLTLALTLTFPVALALHAQQKKTDRDREGLAGAVYAVREARAYPAHPGDPPSEYFEHKTSYYSADGNLTLELEYDRARVVTRRSFAHNGPDEVIEKVEDGGWAPGVDVLGPNPPPSKVILHRLKFDAEGNLILETRFSEDGGLIDKTVFKRDHQGRLLETRVEPYRRGPTTDKTTYSYREGNEPASCMYEAFPGKSITDHYTYEFDPKHNWTKRRTSDSGPELWRTVTYYNPEAASSAMASGIPIPGEAPTDALQPRAASAVAKLIRKSGGVLQASATRRVEPYYPMAARAARITGAVVVEVRIDHFGAVSEAKALSGPRELQDGAVEAAKQWRFQPTALSGVLVDVIGTITFRFQM